MALSMYGPAGFARAPVSKGLWITMGVCSLANLSTPWQIGTKYLSLNWNGLSKVQLWRLVTHDFFWSTPGELIFGMLLLYFFRIFERRFGSKKYSGVLLYLALCSTLLQVILLAAARSVVPALAPGPYSLIFGMFAFFFKDVPHMSRFKFCGIPLTNKILVYILGLQVALSGSWSSLIPSLCGLLAGALYRSELVPWLKQIRVPEAISLFCQRRVAPLFRSSQRRGYERVNQADGGVEMAGGPDVAPAEDGDVLIPTYGQAYAAAPGVQFVPDPAAVHTLRGMGFADENINIALRATNNNLQAATDRLLGGR